MKKLFFISIILLNEFTLFAQDSAAARQEGWPELNIFYNINQNLRLFALYSLTRLRTSNYTDGGVGVYIDYFSFGSLRRKFLKQPIDSTRGYYLWLRGGYYFSVTPPGSKDKVSENTIITEANSRYHLPYYILLTHKNRFDWRFVNEEFKPRYRMRLTVEKELRTEYLYYTPYLYGEYFVNLYSGDANRFRLCLGFDVKVSAHANFETYFLYQFRNDNNEEDNPVDAVNAIGLALKIFLDHQQTKQQMKKIFKKNKKA